MARVTPVSPDKANKEVKDIYSSIEKSMGKVPNIFLNMGNSKAVLEGYLGLSKALNQTSLSPKLREQIALIVSETNQCEYCLSAHTAVAKIAGLPDQEILLARKGEAKDPKTQAILTFAKTIIDKRGHVTDQDLSKLKSAGINDTELVEIFLTTISTMFTNYFNHITDPTVDFPKVPQLTEQLAGSGKTRL
jgi:uncharacterized peroxidase-related enzyme